MSAENHAPNHDYHLVDPSPWPFVGSWSAFVLAFGAVWYFHPDIMLPGMESLGVWKIVPGLLLVLYTMYGWWRDVIREGGEGHHKPVVQLAMRYGTALFIASEVMFFVAFFWAYFDIAFYYDEIAQVLRVEATGGEWPPVGVETFNAWDLPFMNTLILLLSGCTVTWAHHALREGHREQVINALTITVLLGLCFTALQAYEYGHATFGFEDGIYSSVFYMATGFHGFHVIVGTIFLAVCLIRAKRGAFTPTSHFGFEAAAWYWHFVDVVWLFLFVAVYWMGG
ncbi:cytochrome c oxidase subunit 3 [Curvivirga aplysinae]|uniref:cytochrome c oxidase subunit 3 n=1 Tax=Curvivirga aplysinae TaxID=2529852 RepID=UPI0012BCF120|nr:cytochrome c oxidase subunit 3 [Curvivirga aplysinae]MTI11339.1 cytochrome c oxidase subunit 3 [Curvivirga aplysinae]